MTNSVAKTKKQDVATRPEFMKGKGRGSENVSTNDLTIPRLDLIQDLSPQRKKTDPEYINGAEEGMFFNSVSKQLYGDAVIFIPVYFRKEYIIWKSRKSGGGFAGAFPTESDAFAAIEAQDLNPEIHEVVESAQHFGIIVDNYTSDTPAVEEIVMTMSKSKMKANRQLNTMVRMAGGDRFERAYLIQSYTDRNKQNESYMNIKVTQKGYVSENLYHICEKMYESVAGGVKDVVRDK